MALLQCNLYSDVLGMEMNVNVILPSGVKHRHYTESMTDIPVMYLLHGYTEDHTAWMRRTSIERYALGRNIAVVMPAVHRSFYIDMNGGGQYFKYVTEELPALMQNMFNISSKREDNFVAGLSMGGYGAFKTALTFPDRYMGAASLSGALNIHTVFNSGVGTGESFAVFGEHISEENDLKKIAMKSIKKGLPKLYQFCGTEDFLYEDNTDFRDFIQDIASDYIYIEQNGEHTWDLWDKYIQDVFEWVEKINPKIKSV